MKIFQIIFIILAGGLLCADEGKKWFEHEKSYIEGREIPSREITDLPKSITYKILGQSRHQVTIKGLYAFEDDYEPSDFESYCFGFFASEIEPSFLVEDSSLVITSSLPISNNWLAWAIDGLASGSGIMPTWFELVARDLPLSQHYQQDLYTITELDHDFPPGLAWFWLYSDTEFRFPFSPFVYESLGTLIAGPTTASAPAPPRIAIRVLDEDGEVIWKVDNPVEGTIRLAVGDRNEDNFHELYLEVSDRWARKKTTRYVVEPRSEQGGGGQAATRPESK